MVAVRREGEGEGEGGEGVTGEGSGVVRVATLLEIVTALP